MRARRPLLLLLTVPALVVGSLGRRRARPGRAVRRIERPAHERRVRDPGRRGRPASTLFPAATVPPWQTTDGAGEIEIWGTGFHGVPAGEGNAFAELNANTAGTLYQDVISTPGATMSWTLLHRAREGDDTMQVLIGDANVADVNGARDGTTSRRT